MCIHLSSMIYVSNIDGIVLQLQLDAVLACPSSAIVSEAEAVDLSAVRRLGKLATAASTTAGSRVPSWVKVVYLAPLSARIHGLSTLPQRRKFVDPTASPSVDSTAQFWSSTNILLVDTNRQRITATSEKGHPTTKVDTSITPFQLAWPSQIICKEISGLLSDDSTNSSSTETNSTTNAGEFEVYVSEFLGRIWKWTLRVRTSGSAVGSVDFTRDSVPTLLVEKSVFPASIRIREVLNEAKASGVASYDKLFFEMAN